MVQSKKCAVHVFNISDPIVHQGYLNSGVYSPEGLPTTKIAVQKLDEPSDVLDKIANAGEHMDIAILRLVSHGNAGYFDFPGLMRENILYHHYASLAKEHYFAPNARLEIHGCGIASETWLKEDPNKKSAPTGTFIGRKNGLGLVYLRAVARLFQIDVVGAKDTQFPFYNSWKYNGDTIMVKPNGQFRYDSDETRTWDIESQKAVKEKKADKQLQLIKKNYIDKRNFVLGRQELQKLIRDFASTKAALDAEQRLEDPQLRSWAEASSEL